MLLPTWGGYLARGFDFVYIPINFRTQADKRCFKTWWLKSLIMDTSLLYMVSMISVFIEYFEFNSLMIFPVSCDMLLWDSLLDVSMIIVSQNTFYFILEEDVYIFDHIWKYMTILHITYIRIVSQYHIYNYGWIVIQYWYHIVWCYLYIYIFGLYIILSICLCMV